MPLLKSNIVCLSFSGDEREICLSSLLWVSGAVELVSCTTKLPIPEGEGSLFPALSLQFQTAAESVPSSPITNPTGCCSGIAAACALTLYHTNIPRSAPTHATCVCTHRSPDTRTGALFWGLFKGVFQQSSLGKKQSEVFVKASCEENMMRQIETIIRMIIFKGCDLLG